MQQTLSLIALSSLLTVNASAAIVVVEDWQFNSPGDTEGWIADGSTNLDVRAAVSGSESVLSAGASTNDPKLFYTNEITTPVGFQNWETMTIRWRQLDGDPIDVGTATQAYANSGTRIQWPGSGFKQPLPTTSGGDWTFTFEPSGEWVEFTWDISDSTDTPIAANGWRFDPIGDVAGTGYEIDYIVITADVVPEPETYAAILGLGVLGIAWWRRRQR
ncbi:PEP-CTERM sorting domain-containing protein [Cerasicoccus fimbriatus]|uniref:PEP-CTERM sorting domain-containing protein n=1 Tax=Cerasicoccus fimbriatus TaxID=3014554 RepID=UPI0022B5CBA1|nr:PEP-CTERM sorting domain-containing protein [Cerasicoccus sp. TK19100]